MAFKRKSITKVNLPCKNKSAIKDMLKSILHSTQTIHEAQTGKATQATTVNEAQTASMKTEWDAAHPNAKTYPLLSAIHLPSDLRRLDVKTITTAVL